MAHGKGIDRRWALGGGVAVAAGGAYAALAWPHGTQDHRAPAPPGVLRRGNGAEPFTLDPSLSSAIWEDNIIGDLMLGLMTDDENANPVPGMAERWETSEDGLTWTFHLRDAVWSDGVPVTADDFVFGWRRLLDPYIASTYSYFIYFCKNAEKVNQGKLPPSALGIKALDARTLEIHLEHPAADLLNMLTHYATYGLPRHAVEKHGKNWTRPGTYVSNGAYVLTEWLGNDHVALEKNPRFYDAVNVKVEKIIFYPTDDYAAALRRMRAGELDEQDRFPSEQIDWVRANMADCIHQVPQLITDLISVNFSRKPFDDLRVRRAMNLAINREVITNKISRTGNVPAYGLVPPGTANFPGGNALDFKPLPAAARVAKAQALMREAGFGPDNRLRSTLLIRSTSAGAGRASAAAVQQMFSLIYLDVAIIPSDTAIFYNTIQVHDFDIAWPGWQADFDDASTFLDLFITDGGNNWGNYSSREFDTIYGDALNDKDLVSRGRKLAAAEAVLLKDQPFMPLFYWVNADLVRPYVKGWTANPLDLHRTRWITIDEEARRKFLA